MKKKILIKESELNQLVEIALKEYKMDTPSQFYKNIDKEDDSSSQLELEFPDQEKDDVTIMLEERYDEIVEEIRTTLETGGSLDPIYDDKIFPLWKELHKLGDIDIVIKFNQLEDDIINFIEVDKEFEKIKEERDSTLESLKNNVGIE